MENCPLLLMSGALLAMLALSSAEAVLLRRERARTTSYRLTIKSLRVQEDRSRELERRHLNKIHAQQRESRLHRKAFNGMKRNYLSLIRKGYQGLGRLSEKRYSAPELQQVLADILWESGVDPKHSSALPEYIDKALDRAAANLKKDIPGLGEEDVLLFCYLLLDFEPALISKLMGIDSLNTVYSKKKRLLDRIRKLPVEKADGYLDLIP